MGRTASARGGSRSDSLPSERRFQCRLRGHIGAERTLTAVVLGQPGSAVVLHIAATVTNASGVPQTPQQQTYGIPPAAVRSCRRRKVHSPARPYSMTRRAGSRRGRGGRSGGCPKEGMRGHEQAADQPKQLDRSRAGSHLRPAGTRPIGHLCIPGDAQPVLALGRLVRLRLRQAEHLHGGEHSVNYFKWVFRVQQLRGGTWHNINTQTKFSTSFPANNTSYFLSRGRTWSWAATPRATSTASRRLYRGGGTAPTAR
ncbi:hypothetical protein BH20CHL6_BH20CHL6_08340 [soil metagenome]